MRILATADLHLGRRPSSLPDSICAGLSSAEAWFRLVERALELDVRAVLLAGDVVDQDNRFVEATAALEKGLRILARRDIPVIAVAGNHDAAALHSFDKMNQRLPEAGRHRFRLLGRDGRWESEPIVAGGERLTVVGWSFPTPVVRASPLGQFPRDLLDGSPSLGLLHGDRDASSSPWAPFSDSGLLATGVPRWVLGHVHKPDPAGRTPSCYAGSLQGLDVNETGLHGPLLVEATPGTAPRFERLALSRLRYETPALDLGEVADALGLAEAVNLRAGEFARSLAEEDPAMKILVLRPALSCTSARAPSDLLKDVDALWTGQAPVPMSAPSIWLDGPSLEVRAGIDLARDAELKDPRGLLARLILELRGEAPRSEATNRLLAKLSQDSSRFDNPRLREPNAESGATRRDPALEDLLVRQAWTLLGALLAQKPGQARGRPS